MGNREHRDLTDAEVISKYGNLVRWLTNNLRQTRHRHKTYHKKKLENKMKAVFEQIEKDISLNYLLDNLFLVVEDADFDLKDIETIRQLEALMSEPQE